MDRSDAYFGVFSSNESQTAPGLTAMARALGLVGRAARFWLMLESGCACGFAQPPARRCRATPRGKGPGGQGAGGRGTGGRGTGGRGTGGRAGNPKGTAAAAATALKLGLSSLLVLREA